MGDWHPESPARLQAIDDQLIACGLAPLLIRREAPLASTEQLRRVHQEGALAAVRDVQPGPGGYHPIDADTLLNEHSWQAALRAAGAAVAATDAVMAGEFANAFCAIRPPGHHARPDTPMAFACSTMSRLRHAMRWPFMACSASRSWISTCTTGTVPKKPSSETSAC